MKLIFPVATFFVLVNALNFRNAADNIAFYWKLAGAVIVVLFIASLKAEEGTEAGSTDEISVS